MSTTNSHLMKTTRRGRPFVKDTHDLFATLTISLSLDTHRNFFKVYPYSFTTDEAAANLSNLKFSQSNRSADPKDPSRIVTTTTTTTFSMSREMAKGICQHFMEAALIENATDLSSLAFKERGIYQITAKGLHVLERFITKNGITAPHTMRLFAQQPICMKLLHMERRSADDEMVTSKGVVEVLWRRLVGRDPNVSRLSDDELVAQKSMRWYNVKGSSNPADEVDRSIGIVLREIPIPSSSDKPGVEYQFPAWSVIDWMCQFSTCMGPDEAADLGAHFVRYGLISLVSDKGRVKEGNIIATVHSGGTGSAAGEVMQEAEFRATEKAIYKITKDGIRAARWDQGWLKSSSGASASQHSLDTAHDSLSPNNARPRRSNSIDESSGSAMTAVTPSGLSRKPSMKERPNFDFSDTIDKDVRSKDSHTARLKHILDEPSLRSLFREFLRVNFCEENLSFWVDMQDFKRRFNTTSSAIATPGMGKTQRTAGQQVMEKHQQDLIAMAFVIYNTYLAPHSLCELNIDHSLRNELISYMTQISSENEVGAKGHIEPETGSTLHASQLQTTVKLYERIQTYIFRLIATDSVPKFCKTERFLDYMRSDMGEKSSDKDISDLRVQLGELSVVDGSPDLEDRHPSPTRAYLTISQAANEKQANLRQKQLEKVRSRG